MGGSAHTLVSDDSPPASNNGERSTAAAGAVDSPDAVSEDGSSATRWSDIVEDPRKVQPWLARLAGVPALGLIVVASYGLAVDGATVLAVGIIIAGGAFMVGALLGFLFGVPRALADSGRERGVRSNTNLEQISDWLTKILVGVGLVQLSELADASSQLVRSLGPALGDTPSSEAFAAGMLVYFVSTGLMIGYVITRAVVGPLFAQTEWVINSVEPAKPGRRLPDRNATTHLVAEDMAQLRTARQPPAAG
jgi:hypothetical protein